MNVEQILDALRQVIAPQAPDVPSLQRALEVRRVPLDDVFVTLPPHCIRPAVQVLVEQFDLRHLSTVTAQDTGDEIELLYHFWDGQGLTLRTALPHQDAHIATLTDLIPGAAFYEREVSEMLHVTFEGHPDPRPLLLPDDWEGGAPLRLEFVSRPE